MHTPWHGRTAAISVYFRGGWHATACQRHRAETTLNALLTISRREPRQLQAQLAQALPGRRVIGLRIGTRLVHAVEEQPASIYDIIALNDTADGGCRVTERTWDRRPGWFTKTAWIGTGVRDRDAANAAHIKMTLQRLKEQAEAR